MSSDAKEAYESAKAADAIERRTQRRPTLEFTPSDDTPRATIEDTVKAAGRRMSSCVRRVSTAARVMPRTRSSERMSKGENATASPVPQPSGPSILRRPMAGVEEVRKVDDDEIVPAELRDSYANLPASSAKAPAASTGHQARVLFDASKGGSKKHMGSKRMSDQPPERWTMANRRSSSKDPTPLLRVRERRSSTTPDASRFFQEKRRPRVTGEAQYLLEMLDDRQAHGVLLPWNRFRVWWDMMVLALVTYTAVTLPIFLSYSVSIPPAVQGLEISMDVVFLVDIALNFRTAVIEEGRLILDKKGIARHYFSKWFPVDLAGSLPWEITFRIITLVGSSSGGVNMNTSLLTIFKMLKVPKLLRLGRLFKFLERFEGAANIGRILMLMLFMTFFVHVISCLWFLISSSSGGWLESKGYHRDTAWEELYGVNFYAALMMLMGDSTDPITQGELAYSSCIVLLGACMNATIFANVATYTFREASEPEHLPAAAAACRAPSPYDRYVAQIGAHSAKHKMKIESVVRAMRSIKLGNKTRDRLRAYFDYCWIRHHDFEGQVLIASLPLQLRKRVCLECHEDKLRALPLFDEIEGRFVASLATFLSPEVYLPLEYILVAGLVSHRAYFVGRGRVELIRGMSPMGKQSIKVTHTRVSYRDDYFGELGLFSDKQSAITVRSITHVDAYRLEREDFEAVMRSHPAAAVRIADKCPRHFGRETGRLVAQHIYSVAGVDKILRFFQPGHWRPTHGLAKKIRALAADRRFAQELHGIKFRRRGSCTPRGTGSFRKTPRPSSGKAADTPARPTLESTVQDVEGSRTPASSPEVPSSSEMQAIESRALLAERLADEREPALSGPAGAVRRASRDHSMVRRTSHTGSLTGSLQLPGQGPAELSAQQGVVAQKALDALRGEVGALNQSHARLDSRIDSIAAGLETALSLLRRLVPGDATAA